MEMHQQTAWVLSINSSFNHTSNATRGINEELSLFEVQLVCYSLIAFVSIIGNGLIWWRVLGRKRRRVSDYFIINLALSDILVGVLSIPFDLTERLSKEWPFWEFMCKVVYPLQTVLMAVSVLTLLGISIERYRAVVTPLRRKPTRGILITAIISLWVASILVATPYMTVLQYGDGQCNENWPSGSYVAIYTMCIFILLYLGPLLLITVCYASVGIKLKHEMRNFVRVMRRCTDNKHMDRLMTARNKNNLRLCKVFVAVVLVFAVLQLPNHVMYLWYDLGNGAKWRYFSNVLPLCHILTYLNSAVDPFILGVLECRCGKMPNSFRSRFVQRHALRIGRRGLKRSESRSSRVLLKGSISNEEQPNDAKPRNKQIVKTEESPV